MVGVMQAVGALAALSLLAGTAQWQPAPSAVSAGSVTVQAPAPAQASFLQALVPSLPEVSDGSTAPSAEDETPSPEPTPEPTTEPPDCSKLKCVALTMDDGPVAHTTKVLDVLREEHVHATFFVMGMHAEARPGIIRRMVAEGNAVGNHSWNHPQFWHISKKAIRRQLTRTDAVLQRITGKRPGVVRTPYGEIDARVRSVAKSRGQALIQWNVDPADWRDHNTKLVAKRVLKQVRRNSIILSHDVWPTTRHAYRTIIRGLKAKGYTLVTVPELLAGHAKPGHLYFHG